ncbi:hypothetical protein [Brachybacterium sacelli]|uniref:hypothetical protein n=1 Tax=Brachybacterium sacelli TaxID=173364 RepID=UPI00361CE37D
MTVDLLGNDTAGSGSQPLEPESLEISSLTATNLSELEDGRGKRLVIPGEGTYTPSARTGPSPSPRPRASWVAPPRSRTTWRTAPGSHLRQPGHRGRPQPHRRSGAGARGQRINSLLAGLMPSAPSTAMVFGTLVLLLLFGGGVALWIGTRMEADKRDWED